MTQRVSVTICALVIWVAGIPWDYVVPGARAAEKTTTPSSESAEMSKTKRDQGYPEKDAKPYPRCVLNCESSKGNPLRLPKEHPPSVDPVRRDPVPAVPTMPRDRPGGCPEGNPCPKE